MRPVPSETIPLVYGPDDVTEGYYELESVERNCKCHALREHPDAANLWYRGLTLFRRGMLGAWEHTVTEESVDRTVWGLRGQLLGLGVSSAKASLDALLAGYYSAAYSSIRHMLETLVQYLYVVIKPEEANRWYRQPGGPAAQSKSPSMRKMVDAIKADPRLAATAGFIDKVYKSWILMSKGSHPTGEGIKQTVADDGRFVFGATYDREMVLVGFDQGLFAVMMLLQGLQWLRPQDQGWADALDKWRADLRAWRLRTKAALGISDEETDSDVPGDESETQSFPKR